MKKNTRSNYQKLKRTELILLFCTCFFLNGLSQNLSVSGKIVETKTQIPLQFVNIVLQNSTDSSFVCGTISNEKGIFNLNPVLKGNYLLKISYIGFQNFTQALTLDSISIEMGKIALKESAIGVKEVIIKPKIQPFQTGRNNGIIANVASTLLKSVGTANDVLLRIPGITMNDEQIEVFGKGNPIIFINNRQIRDNEELNTLQSSDIATVELITNPGAKYDAEGRSVLLIKTKQKQKGIALQLAEKLKQASRLSHSDQLNFSYFNNGLNLFASYFSHLKKTKISDSETVYINSDDNWEHQLSNPYYLNNNTQKITGGFDQQISKKQEIGGQYAYRFSVYKLNMISSSNSYLNSEEYDQLISVIQSKDKPYQHLANLFYTNKINNHFSSDLTFDFLKNHDQTQQTTNETSDLENQTVITNTQSNYKLYAGKFSNTWHEIDKSLDFGAEYSRISGDGFASNQEGYTKSNIYTNKEIKAAGFISYSRQFKHYKLLAGIRYEHSKIIATEDEDQTVITNKNYSKFYPNFNISTKLNEWTINLALNSRVKRPKFSYLNGNTIYLNRYTYQQGNPYLKKTDIYNFDIQINYKLFYFNSGYSIEKNPVAIVYNENDDPGTLLISFFNYSKNREFYLSLVYKHSLAFWQPNYSLSYRKPFFYTGASNSKLNFNKPEIDLKFYNDFVLPSNFIVSINFAYQTASDSYVVRYGKEKQLDLGLRKLLFHQDLRINLDCNDLFNWKENSFYTISNGIITSKKLKRETRFIQLSLIYRLNNHHNKTNISPAAQDDINRF